MVLELELVNKWHLDEQILVNTSAETGKPVCSYWMGNIHVWMPGNSNNYVTVRSWYTSSSSSTYNILQVRLRMKLHKLTIKWTQFRENLLLSCNFESPFPWRLISGWSTIIWTLHQTCFWRSLRLKLQTENSSYVYTYRYVCVYVLA